MRPFAVADIPAVLAIVKESPGAAQWTAEDYQRVAAGEFDGWVAEFEGPPAGFIVSRRLAGEMEILNLAVAPRSRRLGAAGQLLETALAAGRTAGVHRAYLEVRPSNTGAITFYRRHGFVPAGRRPRYYTDPEEDAMVFSRELV